MHYQVTHRTTYHYTVPVSVCHNLVRLAPRQLPHQSPREHVLQVLPDPVTRSRRFDYFGNQVDYFTIQEAHEELEIVSTSTIHVQPSAEIPNSPRWEQVRDLISTDRSSQSLEALFMTMPTERVANLPDLYDYTVESFLDGRPILDATQELVARIHEDCAFDPSATSVQASTVDFLSHRRGVCQDFTHFAIGCLRSVGLAARYVSGYVATQPPPGMPRLIGADASHAWVAVYTGTDGWVDFDPTNNLRIGTGHVTLAWGRDYSDICPIQGVFVGGGQHSMHVGVDVILIEDKTPEA